MEKSYERDLRRDKKLDPDSLTAFYLRNPDKSPVKVDLFTASSVAWNQALILLQKHREKRRWNKLFQEGKMGWQEYAKRRVSVGLPVGPRLYRWDPIEHQLKFEDLLVPRPRLGRPPKQNEQMG